MSGSLVRLRDVVEGDLETIRLLRRDPELREEIMAAPGPETPATQRAWFDGLAARDDCRVFAIADAQTDGVIGTCGLFGIEPEHGHAEWGFFIGSPGRRNDGSAVDAELQLLDYAFDEHGLRRLWCRVLGRNRSVVSLHRRFGFQIEGTLRQHRKVAGGHDDVVLMGIFVDDYRRARPAIARAVAVLAERARQG